MNKISTLLLAFASLIVELSTANAGEPYVLNSVQMESVTAGLSSSFKFNFNFGRQGLLFNNSRNDLVELERDTSKLSSSIIVNSTGFRSFSTTIRRTGGFNTSYSFK